MRLTITWNLGLQKQVADQLADNEWSDQRPRRIFTSTSSHSMSAMAGDPGDPRSQGPTLAQHEAGEAAASTTLVKQYTSQKNSIFIFIFKAWSI